MEMDDEEVEEEENEAQNARAVEFLNEVNRDMRFGII